MPGYGRLHRSIAIKVISDLSNDAMFQQVTENAARKFFPVPFQNLACPRQTALGRV